MSVFNDPAFLPEAVGSILGQSFRDFEFLIIDDGSTDETRELLAGFSDPRLRLVRNEVNCGLTRALKMGVDLARGDYLTRMDADDVALPDRLERQVAFLDRRPETALLGGACVQINDTGRALGVQRKPEHDLEIRWFALLDNPFIHSSVMLRRHVLRELGLNYDEAFQTAQDYDLWTRLLRQRRGANLAGPLVRYRWRRGVTQQRRAQQLEHACAIAHRTLRDELPETHVEPGRYRELVQLFRLGGGNTLPAGDVLAALVGLYRDLSRQFVLRYRGQTGLGRLRRRQRVLLLQLLARQRFPAGLRTLAARLVLEDPLLAIWVIGKAAQWTAGQGQRAEQERRERSG
jgi:glycosyltransferase involved in cell wall biosynthesis